MKSYTTAVVAQNNDDSIMYSDNNDPLVYFNSKHGWVNFNSVETHNNETLLAQTLELAMNSKETEQFNYKPYVVKIETSITVLNSESFNECMLQRKRIIALSKLSLEDKMVLGLVGDNIQKN